MSGTLHWLIGRIWRQKQTDQSRSCGKDEAPKFWLGKHTHPKTRRLKESKCTRKELNCVNRERSMTVCWSHDRRHVTTSLLRFAVGQRHRDAV